LRYRGFKKRLAWWLYQRKDLAVARVLHATSCAEARGFRQAGLTQPIAIIPNGVELPGTGRLEPRIPRPALQPPHSAVRTALFLGRIHPVKGLLNLVNAWASLSAGRPASGTLRATNGEWKMVIAGGDENGHRAELEAAIRARGLERSFEFAGPIRGEAKWKLYQEADLFILPSHSENFGLVVAEALACGVPVITTRGTPWEELPAQSCGWWVEPSMDALAGALREAFSISDAERAEMGERGRRLIESKYTWPRVAEQMKLVYEWMLSQGPRPDCVAER
jgi:glycosyltransferase involved in cell wall biosynthesis